MLQPDGALCGCPGSMLLHLKSSCNTHHKLLLWSVGPNCHSRNQNSFEKSLWLLSELVTLFSQHFSPGAHLSTALLPKSQPQSLCHTSLLTWGLLTAWTPQNMTTNGCSRSKRAASCCASYTAPLRGNLVAVRPPVSHSLCNVPAWLQHHMAAVRQKRGHKLLHQDIPPVLLPRRDGRGGLCAGTVPSHRPGPWLKVKLHTHKPGSLLRIHLAQGCSWWVRARALS